MPAAFCVWGGGKLSFNWVVIAADAYFRPEAIKGSLLEYILIAFLVLGPVFGPVLKWSDLRRASDCKS